jgi:hypothetical protein
VPGAFTDWHNRLAYTNRVKKLPVCVIKGERRLTQQPAAIRWAVLKAAAGRLTDKQLAALVELEAGDFLIAKAWRIGRSSTGCAKPAGRPFAEFPTFYVTALNRSVVPRRSRASERALQSVEKHRRHHPLGDGTPAHRSARLDAVNGLFQAARARDQGLPRRIRALLEPRPLRLLPRHPATPFHGCDGLDPLQDSVTISRDNHTVLLGTRSQ